MVLFMVKIFNKWLQAYRLRKKHRQDVAEEEARQRNQDTAGKEVIGCVITVFVLYYVVVPLTAYFALSGAGRDKIVAGLFAGILALLPLAALPSILLKNKPNDGTVSRRNSLEVLGWATFAFLLLVLGLLVTFMVAGR
jgi:hypothetical protein